MDRSRPWIVSTSAGVTVVGDRLVCLRNNPQKRLLNGQIWIATDVKKRSAARFGMSLRPDEESAAGKKEVRVVTHAKFFSGEEESLDWSERRRFDEFTFGYCLTVHKAQGSQAAEVTVLLPDTDSRLLTRELLYTAVTRAQQTVRIVGSEAVVRAAVGRRVVRSSGLRTRLAGPPTMTP